MAPPSSAIPAPSRLDWRGANLRGSTLSHMVLDYADFRGADVRDVNFSHSSLRYTDFRGALIQGSNFQHASLYAAKMQGVEADQTTDFRAADVRLVNWGGAYLQGAQLPAPDQPAYGAERRTTDAPQHNGHAPAQDHDYRLNDMRNELTGQAPDRERGPEQTR